MNAAVTARQRMLVSTGLVLVALLVLTGARLVATLPGALATPADVTLADELTADDELAGAWYDPAITFLGRYHRAATALLFLVGALGMLLRTGVSLRTLDFLYNDSERADARGYLAFLLDTLAVVAQLTLLIAMTVALDGPRPGLAPVLLVVLLAVNGVWLFWLGMRRVGDERRSLRGVWRAGLLSLLFAAGLAAYLWCFGTADVSAAAANAGVRSLQASIAGVAMLLLCAMEIYVQSATYGERRRSPFVRYAGGLVVALILLALAARLFYEQAERISAPKPAAPQTQEQPAP